MTRWIVSRWLCAGVSSTGTSVSSRSRLPPRRRPQASRPDTALRRWSASGFLLQELVNAVDDAADRLARPAFGFGQDHVLDLDQDQHPGHPAREMPGLDRVGAEVDT